MDSDIARRRPLAWGVGGVFLWLIIFSGGALINSRGYREVLDPPEMRAPSDAEKGAPAVPAKPIRFRDVAINIVPAALLYTPTNAAILCALAGFIGGCGSNVVIAREQRALLEAGQHVDLANVDALLRRRLAYMTESPFISMSRGFIVYLAFMAGILVVVDDPFKDPTGATYLRYVGTVSLIAFTVGYDPTRFEELVKRVPTIGPSGTLSAGNDGKVAQVTTTQRQIIADEVSQTRTEIRSGGGALDGKPRGGGGGAKPPAT